MTASWTRGKWSNIWYTITMTAPTTIWCSPAWCTSPHPTEHGTPVFPAEAGSPVRRLRPVSSAAVSGRGPAGLWAGQSRNGRDPGVLPRLTTVFYIGGTKVGALCGEAVVFPKGAPEHFFTMVKQQGALLAKGRLLGIQFDDAVYGRSVCQHQPQRHSGGGTSPGHPAGQGLSASLWKRPPTKFSSFWKTGK